MSTVVVIGTQWGDEGKGKIVDYLASQADTVVRYQGGSNAGHTVIVKGEAFKLRQLPSGILYEGTHNVIADGVALDPVVVLQEIDEMKARGIDVSNIHISERAHVVMPYHYELDRYDEGMRANGKNGRIGTTSRGIGPCYMDRDLRIGIRVCDLLEPYEFSRKVKSNLGIKNDIITKVYGGKPLKYEVILKQYSLLAAKLRPYVCDTMSLLNIDIDANRKVLFEGAQATMLDIDYGTYPYVTASHPISGGVTVGTGVAPKKLDTVVGVVKAYCTRVGRGPFPTEQTDLISDELRERGHEYGTVTGRPRRIGWLDACALRYAATLSGLDYLAITRLDILDTLKEIPLCVGYKYRDKNLLTVPASLKTLGEVEPVYEIFPGWRHDTSKIRSYANLPAPARDYLKRVSELAQTPIGLVSVGPERDQTIVVAKDIF